MNGRRIETGRISWLRWKLFEWRSEAGLGEWGEWLALAYIRRLGWDVVARNWTWGRGEIDLVAYEGPRLVFVEVKCRKMPAPLPAEEQVDERKRQQLEVLGNRFRDRYELLDVPGRYDLIAIHTPDARRYVLRHYRDFL